MNRYVFILGLILFSSLILAGCKKIPTGVSQNNQSSSSQVQKNQFKFTNPKKSAHYETNTPAHGAILAGVPINVVIDFNFDLGGGSEISIKKDGKEYGVGEVTIDQNKLSMRRKMEPASRDGVYTVSYKACWPDGSCHDGQFQFAIDRSKSAQYTDMTGQTEVTVELSNVKFVPENIKVTRGTRITWLNNDSVEHYINTDSHPAHTYFPNQNSRVLGKGDQYSLVFSEAGIYPYHCSAHASSMSGSILVE